MSDRTRHDNEFENLYSWYSVFIYFRNLLQRYNIFCNYANFIVFFLKNSHPTQGNNVFIIHNTTAAIAACGEPNTAIAHAPRTPISAIGTLGVIVTSR